MFAGGSLKLKGDSSAKVAKKKKKKSSSSTQSEAQKGTSEEQQQNVGSASASATALQKTEAQLNLERIQRERLEKKIEMLAEKSHKDRVNDFNKYLSKLSEHHGKMRSIYNARSLDISRFDLLRVSSLNCCLFTLMLPY